MHKMKKLLSILLSVFILFSSSFTVLANEPIDLSEELNYYYIEEEVQARSLWDFVDIAMAGASWYELLKDPSLRNLSWAVLDTAAIAPLIPSSRWIRQGAKYAIPMGEIKKLASTSSGKNKLLKALKVTKPVSKLDEIAKLAKNYKLTNSQYTNHILKNHAYNTAVPNKSKFYKNFDIKRGIKETLTSDSIIKNNTNSREGYIFIKKYSKAIGTTSNGKTPLYNLKVVLDKKGYVVTAYPIK